MDAQQYVGEQGPEAVSIPQGSHVFTARGDGIVQVAYLHPERVSHSWFDSMRRMWEYDAQAGLDVTALDRPAGSERIGGNRIERKPLNIRCTSASLMTARNFATRLFLHRTTHEWFMFIDTDMGFDDDAIHRLLDVADPIERPIVGGLCFAHYEAEYDGKGGYRFTVTPTMYRIGTTTKGVSRFCFYGEYPENEVTRVAATGAAFLIIHRSVFQRMAAKYGEHWWSQVTDEDGDMVGEDMAFCARANALQIPIHVHTGVKTTHHKDIWLQEEDYLKQAIVQGSLVSVAPAEPQLDGAALPPELAPAVDIGESLATLARNEHDNGGMLKLRQDLDRYVEIIEATKPDLIIETGTWNGVSARWFAARGIDVISIDIDSPVPSGIEQGGSGGTITFVRGNSTDPALLHRFRQFASGYERVMVVLDSDHHAAHVAAEIEAYGPLVTPGCYLVVEDTLHDYAPDELLAQHYPGGDSPRPGPLVAVARTLAGSEQWSRDIAIERLSPVSHSPAGWWVRRV